ncbi:hypothetical protein [Deinococcus peraridilitoris]|uniref:DinB family protein n=1 Tax=Deinococcus peraridilitoris (strain DSM 19664 / LMG 22246 / CIP 109416 / KR-200) TaxID=937777 RepID=L0A6Q6_DEIPD|nr:hypothetical protein [Deinococcus peraridilitoris]AFZ69563.1 hypothetical protein Deipe_4200 [Deinococcus peraridilitoris DSM 19664]
MKDTQQLLRHQLASLAYRTNKALHGAPAGFEAFELGYGVRTPHALLRHMTGLLSYTIRLLEEQPDSPLDDQPWAQECQRFTSVLATLDQVLQQRTNLALGEAQLLLQGPLSDAMAHAGQLALLRRAAGAPISPENFTRADIHVRHLQPED